MENATDLIVHWGIRIVGALAIFLIGRWVAGVIKKTLRRVLTKREVDPSLVGFLCNLAWTLILVFTLIAVINQFGVQTASFVAIIGAASFAVGLALQGSLSNFASGVLLLSFRPFKVGDFIEAGGAAGVVKEIQLFNTVLATGDNIRIIMPNSAVFSGVIKNYSANETRRVDLLVGIGYGSPIDKAMTTVLELIKADSRILADPAPMVAVSELADSSVNLVIRSWVATGDYWGVKFDLTKSIKEKFDSEGIEIPFPQRVVHMQQG